MDHPMSRQEQLLEIRKGNRQAFDELCRDVIPMLSSYARCFLKDEWADDVVQDVLVGFWQNRREIDPAKSVNGYLLKGVYNRSLNYLRKEKLLVEFKEWNDLRIAYLGLDGADPDGNETIKSLYDKDLRKSIDKAIEILPPKCRQVFTMSYLENLKNREISEKLGISLSTVENHIYSALKILRKALSKDKLLLFLTLLPYLGENAHFI